MTITVLNTETSIRFLREVVAAEGAEYVYAGSEGRCYYAHNGAPDCLIGRVLTLAGWSLQDLAGLDDGPWGDSVLIGEIADFSSEFSSGRVSSDGAEVLAAAQGVQDRAVMACDSDATWGRALQAAEAVAASFLGVGRNAREEASYLRRSDGELLSTPASGAAS